MRNFKTLKFNELFVALARLFYLFVLILFAIKINSVWTADNMTYIAYYQRSWGDARQKPFGIPKYLNHVHRPRIVIALFHASTFDKWAYLYISIFFACFNNVTKLFCTSPSASFRLFRVKIYSMIHEFRVSSEFLAIGVVLRVLVRNRSPLLRIRLDESRFQCPATILTLFFWLFRLLFWFISKKCRRRIDVVVNAFFKCENVITSHAHFQKLMILMTSSARKKHPKKLEWNLIDFLFIENHLTKPIIGNKAIRLFNEFLVRSFQWVWPIHTFRNNALRNS